MALSGVGVPLPCSVVFSIHNMNYGLPLIEEAMQFSNRCTTVSPTYALEISGEPAIAPHMSKFLGIRNGIDGDIWDPQVKSLSPPSLFTISSDRCVGWLRTKRVHLLSSHTG